MADIRERLHADLSDNARRVLARRYLIKDDRGNPVEEPEDMFWRVARNIAEAEAVYGGSKAVVAEGAERFYEAMVKLLFLPNSPTLMNAGREFQQLSACFVLPIEDSIVSIFETLRNTALIHKSGGGTGFAFSRLRPKDDIVSSTKGVSSGPVSFMQVFDAATDAIKQGGTRRGANMAVLRVDHPDILDFIDIKRDESLLTNFNISVAVPDAFMAALAADTTYSLINPRGRQVVGELKAREVFDRIVDGAWTIGDPGVVFIDRINRDNPTPVLGDIESTNPCGEQPLLPYESCNLGSINLARMVAGDPTEARIDWDLLAVTVRLAVRFLDNVIDMNRFPLEQIEMMTKGNRKIGLGVMGFADMLLLMGIPYDSDRAVEVSREVMSFLQDRARAASSELADDRGVFPNWKGSIWEERGLKVRNATTTTIAPTGTISIMAGCSSGVEPLFAVAFSRHVLSGETLVEVNPIFEDLARDRGIHSPELLKAVAERGAVRGLAEVPPDLQELFVTAHEISPDQHVRIQAAFQDLTDNAVSKTINFRHEATREEVARAYQLAYDLGCKGITVYRDGCREEQVLTTGQTEKARATMAVRGIQPRPRPEVVEGQTRVMATGCGKLYITVNFDDGEPFEIFGNMGKAGGCAASQTEGLARMISMALRAGIPPGHVIKQLKGISCHLPAWEQGGGKILSCADAFAKALERCIQDAGGQLQMEFDESGKQLGAGACPECGGALTYEEGCNVCRDCGYSQCE
jgi:ribonucleoside-diphosphate reductase alpha chain